MGESHERKNWKTDGENEEGQTNSRGNGGRCVHAMDRDGSWELMKFNFSSVGKKILGNKCLHLDEENMVGIM